LNLGLLNKINNKGLPQPNYFLADPSCLCLQEVVSEVQRNESEIHAHFDGYSFINWNVSLEAAII
jgi:hypothetical protein